MEVGGGVVVEATVAVGGHSRSGGNGGRVPIEPRHEHRTLINHVRCHGLSRHKSSHIHQFREVLYKGIRFSDHSG